MDLKPNKEAIDLLKEIEIFSDLSDDELTEVTSLLEVQKYDAGKELFKEGDPGGQMFIIGEGTVEVQKKRSHGTGSVVIARFDRGGVIGEMSILDGMPRSATVIAVQATRVYILTVDMFNEMMTTKKDLSIKVVKGLARLLSLRLRNTSGWFADVF